jgi:metallo-beta-lactamase family protein
MLNDTAHIQKKDAEYLNRKEESQGLPPIEPLYDAQDVDETLSQFRGIGYQKGFYVAADIQLTFHDAGHILGSSLPIFDIKENGRNLRLGYIVDLGRKNLPILRDPELVSGIQFMIIESTYGNRLHEDPQTTESKLAQVVNETVTRKGKIIIPAFSLGRTQEIVYNLHRLQNRGAIPHIPIFVDSPLSVGVTEIFKLHPECFDQEINQMISDNQDPFGWKDITYVKDVEESKKLSQLDQPCIIISASGMCESGRILHHLKNNIENPNNTIMVVGFMAKDTLGRRIVERQKKVKIFGDEYSLNAKVEVFDAFSAHADRKELLEYVEHTKDTLEGVFIVHGEEEQSRALAEGIKGLGIQNVIIPDHGEEVQV